MRFRETWAAFIGAERRRAAGRVSRPVRTLEVAGSPGLQALGPVQPDHDLVDDVDLRLVLPFHEEISAVRRRVQFSDGDLAGAGVLEDLVELQVGPALRDEPARDDFCLEALDLETVLSGGRLYPSTPRAPFRQKGPVQWS
jgi:hypothetical protein